MPKLIPCANLTCDRYADEYGKLCRECQQKADEAERRRDANKWRWAGFNKSTDNHRKGYNGDKP